MELIAEGAEAKIYRDNDILIKKRLPKPYRLEVIDKRLRKFRNRREFKVLNSLYENGVNVPKPIAIDEKDFSFTLEFIQGKDLKEVLTLELLEKAFEQIMKMHDQDIIHGDLTTMNMLVRDNNVYIIDFGLAEFTNKIENKAVDLNLFLSCIKNEHPDFYKFKQRLLEEYKKLEIGPKVVERLEIIEHRGRNK